MLGFWTGDVVQLSHMKRQLAAAMGLYVNVTKLKTVWNNAQVFGAKEN